MIPNRQFKIDRVTNRAGKIDTEIENCVTGRIIFKDCSCYLGKSLTPHKITWSAKVILGNRAQEIARQADVVGADLIILIAPRISLDSPEGWGSLSYKVGLLAKCPVLLVK